jgi:hypothetical protein
MRLRADDFAENTVDPFAIAKGDILDHAFFLCDDAVMAERRQ